MMKGILREKNLPIVHGKLVGVFQQIRTYSTVSSIISIIIYKDYIHIKIT